MLERKNGEKDHNEKTHPGKNMNTNMNWTYISNRFLLYHLILSQFMMIGYHATNHQGKKSHFLPNIQKGKLKNAILLTGETMKYKKADIPN